MPNKKPTLLLLAVLCAACALPGLAETVPQTGGEMANAAFSVVACEYYEGFLRYTVQATPKPEGMRLITAPDLAESPGEDMVEWSFHEENPYALPAFSQQLPDPSGSGVRVTCAIPLPGDAPDPLTITLTGTLRDPVDGAVIEQSTPLVFTATKNEDIQPITIPIGEVIEGYRFERATVLQTPSDLYIALPATAETDPPPSVSLLPSVLSDTGRPAPGTALWRPVSENQFLAAVCIPWEGPLPEHLTITFEGATAMLTLSPQTASCTRTTE